MDKNYQCYSKPEIWGGIECTINRIGNSYRDQLASTGHYERPGDIDLIADLDIKYLRYPVLWEFHQPEENRQIDWSWIRLQLTRIKKNKITPIAGLVHHGSGPAFTDLTDPYFAEKLSDYAYKVACEFPWLEYYTPVNEPLTTARFSGLYGHWYPHHKNDFSFATMLLNQVKGIILSMKRIRRINPNAKLIQTEDLGYTHSTKLLKYQADFENNRRWLTYDLLCGKINKDHPLWGYFLHSGISESQLGFFIDNACAPDILGVNYYITSERFLDENVDEYPAETHGANFTHRYADTEAVRCHRCKLRGIYNLLMEVWTRYQIPIAVTEVHMNCTREEQMRWFMEVWSAASNAKKNGASIRAVTAWALFGSMDWDTLLTKENGNYESGVYTVDNPSRASPTAMTKLIKELANKRDFISPLLNREGWWRNHAKQISSQNHSLVILTGQNNFLKQIFVEVFTRRAIPFVYLNSNELDLYRYDEMSIHNPWAIINISEVHKITRHYMKGNARNGMKIMGAEINRSACNRNKIQIMTVWFEGLSGFISLNSMDQLGLIMKEFRIQKSESARYVETSDIPMQELYTLLNAALDLLIDERNGLLKISEKGQLKWIDSFFDIQTDDEAIMPLYDNSDHNSYS